MDTGTGVTARRGARVTPLHAAGMVLNLYHSCLSLSNTELYYTEVRVYMYILDLRIESTGTDTPVDLVFCLYNFDNYHW